MQQIDDFSDQRHKSWCIHCGQPLGSRQPNRDHVPSKSLLLEPSPANLPVVKICVSCNQGFSLDEEYFLAFLGSVLTGSTDPANQTNPRVQRILERSPQLRLRIESSKEVVETADGDQELRWKPERFRIERILVKNSRGHVYFELGESLLDEPESVWFEPLSSFDANNRDEFETIESAVGWPEVGSRMMSRIVAGGDFAGGWITVQEGVYRYAVTYGGGITVKMVLFEYLGAEVRWA
jgi:hypothetical protein